MKNSPFDTFIDRRQSSSIKWQKFSDNIIPMWVADMEFATPEVITEALKERIDHPIFGYTAAPQSLIRSVADYCEKRHDWKIDTQFLHWIPGVLPALTAACKIAGDIDDEIIVFPPVYHPLLLIPEKIGRKRVDVPMKYSKGQYANGTWSIDFDLLEASISKKTVAILLSSPHNPMGTMFSEEELHRLAAISAAHNLLLVSDEIHCDLILSEEKKHVPTALAAKEHHKSVLTIMSPSKTFNIAGANCSFAHITDDSLGEKLAHEIKYTVPFVPTLSFTAAEAAYSKGWQWHARLIDYLRSNHDYLHRIINESEFLSMDKLDATYLAWIDTSRLQSEDANEFFKAAGVGLSPGSQFGNESYQRLNFACTRAQLEEGVSRMLNAIEQR